MLKTTQKILSDLVFLKFCDVLVPAFSYILIKHKIDKSLEYTSADRNSKDAMQSSISPGER